MGDLNIHTFNIGQGLFNFVCEQYTEGEEEKTYCGIIDCGSHIGTKGDFQGRIEEIAADMKSRYGNAALDYVIISHQDEDHWNYLISFLQSYYEFSFDQWNIRGEGKGLFRVWENKYCERCRQWGNRYFYRRVYIINQYFNFCNAFPKMMMTEHEGNIKYSFSLGKACCVAVRATRDKYAQINVVETSVKAKYAENRWQYESPLRPDDIDKVSIAKFMYDNNILGRTAESAIVTMLTELMKHLDINIAQILQNEGRSGKKIYIKKMMTGGFDWGQDAEKIREILRLIGVLSNYPCALFRVENRKWKFVCDSGFYDIKKIKANAIRKNASSLMIFYTCSKNDVDYSAFFPGDATFHSFDRYINIIRKQEIAIDYLVAPHHGSFNTNIVLDKTGEEVPYKSQPLSKFVNVTEPQNVVFSARHDIFGHPNKRVAEILSAETRDDVAQHLFIAYGLAYSKQNGWEEKYVMDTKDSIYTTESNGDITYINDEVVFEMTGLNTGLHKSISNNLTVLDDMFI